LHKAQRGELFHRVPTGYVKLSTERVKMDPDEQVRVVVQLIFDKYDEFGSSCRPHKRVRSATGDRTSAGNWVPMDQ
jgi:hypothetical protein